MSSYQSNRLSVGRLWDAEQSDEEAAVFNLPCRAGIDGGYLIPANVVKLVTFIDQHNAVAVTSSDILSSAAAVCLVYLMAKTKCTLKVAMRYCQEHHIPVLPEGQLLQDLIEFEVYMQGKSVTTLQL
ncbi:hypothetical protein EB796_002365 [Bugula neritina]|uniref:Uncharacterized protein n=1 Tax=Bugula neritina TaxID=10212 RepID=A0A7J7KMF4_BUGNE|nr:hypothetical protein EB796_002365 [Bugula neritina]